jgi:acyl phosphate:glycerol-3-phosphate acyltransferase
MQTLWMIPAALLAAGYLLGSIPFGVVLTRLFGAGDLRQIGSGSIGATNVLRTGRKGLAAATLIFDLLKGTAAVLLAYAVSPDDAPLAGAAAVLGHLYPVWLAFRGGKGAATLMGVVVALSPLMGLVYAILWVGAAVLLRLSSVASMLAAVSVPVSALAFGRVDLFPLGLSLALIVIWRHRSNIARLMAGTEPRIGGDKASAQA